MSDIRKTLEEANDAIEKALQQVGKCDGGELPPQEPVVRPLELKRESSEVNLPVAAELEDSFAISDDGTVTIKDNTLSEVLTRNLDRNKAGIAGDATTAKIKIRVIIDNYT
ncbi:hypothetical protein Pan241w_27720 [Gimesia alba]|uniref:Uncharacterized protein n=1 Tax=Gimesia alba TaxID=2527973 RepID=A0A517RFP3_9PLAN|nr:hypothetical protein [Gimesia alba]QDT42684.1 hypothetical protein Pan241w_27720 [Gimesia alba]